MDKYIARSNIDSKSIPCKERDGKWTTGNEYIFKSLLRNQQVTIVLTMVTKEKRIFRLLKQEIFATAFSLFPSSLTFSSLLNNIFEPETSSSSNLTDLGKKRKYKKSKKSNKYKKFYFVIINLKKVNQFFWYFQFKIGCLKQLKYL